MANPSRHSASRTNPRQDIVRSAFVLNTDNLGNRVVSGASFTFLGIALRTLITLGSMAVLARLLVPADFGYIAMATVVTELASLFGGFGLTNILIQRRRVSRLQLDSVFWVSTIVGVSLALAVYGMSFLAGWLFTEPKTGELLRVMCVTFVIGGLTSVHEAILIRLMRFRTEFWIQITAIATRALTAIIFALLGFGVWSLVVGALSGAVVAMMLYYIAVPYRPRFRFHGAYLLSTWRTSGSYFGSGLLYYVNMNVDIFLIGRHMGAGALGYYQNARSLTDEVRARIAMPLQRVLFPAFSALQKDHDRFQYSVIRAGRLLAAIIIPIGFGVSAIAVELVPVLYGSQWYPMIPVLSMLGLSAAVRGSTAIASSIFNAKNRVGLALRYNLIGTALMIGGVVLALPYGLDRVAMAVALASLYSLWSFRVGLGLIGLNTKHVLQILGPATTAAAVMWLAITGARSLEAAWSAHPGLLLPMHIILGAGVYAITLHLLSRSYLREFMDLGKKMLKKA